MIKTIENLNNLGATLRELELYDNQISKLENLESLVNLEILDVSHNRIRKIEGLENKCNKTQGYYAMWGRRAEGGGSG